MQWKVGAFHAEKVCLMRLFLLVHFSLTFKKKCCVSSRRGTETGSLHSMTSEVLTARCVIC